MNDKTVAFAGSCLIVAVIATLTTVVLALGGWALVAIVHAVKGLL